MKLVDADRLLTDRMKSKYYHLPNGDIAIPIIDIEYAPDLTWKLQEILDYLDNELHPIISPEHWNIYSELHDMISMLSSPAYPERKRGKWIVYYECPKCGEITKNFTEYCPFCNADMRGEEDE